MTKQRKEKEKGSTVMITSTFSRYEVWTKDSISIFERRQRLLEQMGRVKEQGNANAVDRSTVSSSGNPVEVPFGSAQKLNNCSRGADHDDPIMRNMKQCFSGSEVTRPEEEEDDNDNDAEEEDEAGREYSPNCREKQSLSNDHNNKRGFDDANSQTSSESSSKKCKSSMCNTNYNARNDSMR